MKKLFLIIALAGFTATGSYAQNAKKNCSCKHKTVHHTVYHKRDLSKKGSEQPDKTMNAILYTAPTEKTPCYTYNKGNIVVTECPDILYDKDGNMYYNTQGVYLGNYPRHAQPPATNNDNYEGRAHGGDNLCLWNCK